MPRGGGIQRFGPDHGILRTSPDSGEWSPRRTCSGAAGGLGLVCRSQSSSGMVSVPGLSRTADILYGWIWLDLWLEKGYKGNLDL